MDEISPVPHTCGRNQSTRRCRTAPARESIPADLSNRLGTTHYDGRCSFTDKPYLLEGADEIQRLGLKVAKFWPHEDDLPGYAFGSDWGISLCAIW